MQQNLIVNVKIKEFANIFFEFHLNILDMCFWRAGIAPFYYFIDVDIITFKDCFHASIVKVTYPTSNAVSYGQLLSILPKIDALNLATDKYMSSDFFLGIQ